jgi:predicted XRE-type DNA-binding protein
MKPRGKYPKGATVKVIAAPNSFPDLSHLIGAEGTVYDTYLRFGATDYCLHIKGQGMRWFPEECLEPVGEIPPHPEVVYAVPLTASQAIAEAICEANLTQAEVARRMGVTRQVVTRLVNEAYNGHSTASLRAIADALGLNLMIEFRPKKEVE